MAKKGKKKSKNGRKNKITPRNRKFIENYINSGNLTQAYIEAGYSKNGAGNNAFKLIKNDQIIQEIDKRRLEIANQNNVTAARIINELAKIAFLKTTDVFHYAESIITTEDGKEEKRSVAYLRPEDELTDAALSSIASIKETNQGLEIKLYDKQKALDSLSKYVGLSNEAEISKAKEIRKEPDRIDINKDGLDARIKSRMDKLKNGSD